MAEVWESRGLSRAIGRRLPSGLLERDRESEGCESAGEECAVGE